RVLCPDDNTLLAMVEHAIDPVRFGELETHIDSCEHCRVAVAALLAVGTPKDEPSGAHALPVSDHYTIKDELGRGGMGTVYLAHDRTLGRDVALKVHRAGSGNDRLQREALAMAKLAHPNVVTVFEIGTFEDRLYVAMEYVRGGTFREWLAHGHGWKQILAMLKEVGAGLAAAHDAGLVHRDLKPENILVAMDGRPRVSDFGLARVGASVTPVPEDTPIEKITVTGAVIGTPAYMAPEQLAGDVVDARSDQFAFCVVAWEALFGQRPWGGATLKELEKAIHKHELRPSRDVPERVRKVIERGLAIEPGDRFVDVRTLLAALDRATAPRTRWWIAASVVGTALVVGGSYAGYRQVSERRLEAACLAAGDSVRKLVAPDMRAAIHKAFAATGVPFADSSFQHAEAVLGRYADTLATKTVAVCRDETAPAVQRTCLDEHRTQLATYVDALTHADAAAVQRAPDVAWSILDAQVCEHPESAPVLRHDDAQALAAVRTLEDQGKFKEAAAQAQAIVTRAHDAKDDQLELAALFDLADAQHEIDPYSLSKIQHRAETLAESLGRDADAARALVSLGNYEGIEHHDYAAAHADFDLAKAKLARLGDTNLVLRGNVQVTEAQVFMYEGRLGEAEGSVRSGVAALRQALGPDHPKLGIASAVLSQILDFQNKHEEALVAARDAERIMISAYGEQYPMLAGVWMAEAQSLMALQKTGDARALLQRADAMFAKYYGSNNETRAKILVSLGELDTTENHFDAATKDYRDALAIVERLAGPNSEEAGGLHRDVAYALALQQKLDEAIPEAEKGVAILDALGPAGEPRLIGALTELANMYTAKGRSGIAAARRAVALAEKRGAGAEDVELQAARDALKNAK
ncbi:MAG TPA: serine/threonine-protein kinase, partial [Kofleriaceae bacterium]|nr:serine/threonine-protein kinase [Kofleriaceae bacterium]